MRNLLLSHERKFNTTRRKTKCGPHEWIDYPGLDKDEYRNRSCTWPKISTIAITLTGSLLKVKGNDWIDIKARSSISDRDKRSAELGYGPRGESQSVNDLKTYSAIVQNRQSINPASRIPLYRNCLGPTMPPLVSMPACPNMSSKCLELGAPWRPGLPSKGPIRFSPLCGIGGKPPGGGPFI